MTGSLLDRYPVEELHEMIDLATPDELAVLQAGLEAELYDWNLWARPKQLPPPGEWLIWLLVTGRGWGKNRTAASWLRTRALETRGDYAICAPVYSDVKGVCVEGGTPQKPSGFLTVCAPGEITNYNRSLGEITMSNGSRIKMLSADEPNRAQGWNFTAAWCDEFSSWTRPETWTRTLLPAVRMADSHRFVITTTPKRNDLTRMILARADADPARVVLVRGKTSENEANLGEDFEGELRSFMSADMARQELEGELVEDVKGALWKRALIASRRHAPSYDDEGYLTDPDLTRLVIAVDPAGGGGDGNDDTGIVIVGRNGTSAYVLRDETCHLPPTEAMARVAELYRTHAADSVVIEVNMGWDYVPALLHSIDSTIKCEKVSAKRGKLTRAEPVHGLMENGRVWFLNGEGESFPALEDQLTSWVPGDPSPDRLDAFVWGVTALFPELEAGQGARLHFRGAA